MVMAFLPAVALDLAPDVLEAVAFLCWYFPLVAPEAEAEEAAAPGTAATEPEAVATPLRIPMATDLSSEEEAFWTTARGGGAEEGLLAEEEEDDAVAEDFFFFFLGTITIPPGIFTSYCARQSYSSGCG